MNNIKMLIRLIWLMLFLKQEFVKASVVCMEKEVNLEMITVNCTVDDFVSDIDFKFPNNTGNAYCVLPVEVTSIPECDCKCNFTRSCTCTITPDIQTKTTTLQIMDKNLTDMFGWYTCSHGFW